MNDDQELMLKYQAAGDVPAFEELYRRYSGTLYRFLLRVSRNQAIAADVSQQTWIRLIELAERGRYEPNPGSSFQAFLYTLGRNRYLDEYVRNHEVMRRESGVHAEEMINSRPSNDPDPDELLDHAASRRGLDAAVAALPLEQREVIVMWAQGMSVESMAHITGASPYTVVSRRKYAIRRLRATLSRETQKDKERA